MNDLEGLGKALPLVEIYRDLAQPATKEVGAALGNVAKVARFVLAPIDFLAAQHGRWARYLERVAEKVPEERRVDGHPQIAGPVLEGLRYAEENGITAELFLNLLARAIDRERLSEAHPAFAHLIAQLSPDEALILCRLKQHEYLLRHRVEFRSDGVGHPPVLLSNSFPVDELLFPDNFMMYMEHLRSLNLAGIFQVGPQQPIKTGKPERQIGVNINSRIALSDSFGEMFARACVPDEFLPSWRAGQASSSAG